MPVTVEFYELTKAIVFYLRGAFNIVGRVELHNVVAVGVGLYDFA